MRTRLEYNNNPLGLRLAMAKRENEGGRVVTTEDRIFWYSYEHTPLEIFNDHHGKSVDIHD